MRCKACDFPLSDKETTRRSAETGDYPDLCDNCIDEEVVESPFASEQVRCSDVLFDVSTKGDGK